jgi:hypothetical protein
MSSGSEGASLLRVASAQNGPSGRTVERAAQRHPDLFDDV